MADAARTIPQVPATPWMKRLPPALRLILQGDARVRAAAGAAFGVAPSEEACRARVGQGRAALWMGPDEHLLIAVDVDSAERTIADLEQAIGGLPHSLVDISHRQFAFEICGPRAADILNAGCPLDLGLAQFPVNMCTRTVFTKADILLWRTEEETFQVEVWRSFEDYLVKLLREIAREFESA